MRQKEKEEAASVIGIASDLKLFSLLSTLMKFYLV